MQFPSDSWRATPPATSGVRLDDGMERECGRVYLTGMQAMVRLMLEQHRRDAAVGLATAGFVSGYRGSPLGGFDTELLRHRERLDRATIRFQPGINEELAATAVLGTQQASVFGGARQDGVFALWYGKGPGVDRSGDAFRHGVRAGAARHGGVLLAFGDDHPGKSSTVAHQSDPGIAALGIAVLYPATIEELIRFGLAGWAASRASGLWVGMKCLNETAEATGIVDLDRLAGEVRAPLLDGIDPGALHTRMAFDPAGDEERHIAHRLPALAAFFRANPVDRLVHGPPGAPLLIIASGKAALDVVDALGLLGVGDEGPVAVLKMGLIWPADPALLGDMARGRRDLLVVEEKAPFLEPQVARALYNLPAAVRPRLHGKERADGRRLLPEHGTFDAVQLALAIAGWMADCGVAGEPVLAAADRLRRRDAAARKLAAGAPVRRPWFCAGCPHNRSTGTPEGSTVLTGIGCHTMAIWMDRRALPPTQMGGEGANWIGMAPFVDTPHLFQNLGDGTFNHSGLLAIRAAVAAGTTITFQILFNDAVAMTGGQPHDGQLTVADVVRQVRAEKVARVEVVAIDPDRPSGGPLPAGMRAHPRDRLAAVQRQLREQPGVTVLIYDQGCAAVLRRQRKRGDAPTPARRVLINEAVCEGCGDCSVQSNCVAIVPVPGDDGVKRAIDQSACNRDFSCVRGLCPSFVELEGATLHGASAALPDGLLLPEPAPVREGDSNILVAGVGGTGVVTIGALIGMAAHVEGRQFLGYDMTGLAQKGGAVFGHVRVLDRGDRLASPRVPPGHGHLLLGLEPQVAASAEALAALDPERGFALLDSETAVPGEFQIGAPVATDVAAYRDRIAALVGAARVRLLPARATARRLFGDSVYANMLLLGAAAQLGLLPVGIDALEEAIRINGASVARNLAAFRAGRMLAADPEAFVPRGPAAPMVRDLDALIAERARLFRAWQDEAHAGRFLESVGRARAASAGMAGAEAFVRAVATGLGRVMAYKDEYEVARLYGDAAFGRQLAAEFADPGRLSVWLAPPLFSRRDPDTGRPRKRRFGPWVFPLFRMLARMRFVRGRWYDPFGWQAERRRERQAIIDHEARIARLCARLTPGNIAVATEIAGLPDAIRGFGPVKEAAAARVLAREPALWTAFDAAGIASPGGAGDEAAGAVVAAVGSA